MAPKKESTGLAGALTERDMQILANAVAFCAKAPVEVDYGKLAERVGLKNAASARTAWHTIRKKIDALADAEGGETASSGNKRKADEGEDGAEAEADEKASEKKKTKKKGKKAAAAAAAAADADADAEAEAEAETEEDEEAAAEAPKKKKKKGKKAATKVKDEVEEDAA